MKRKVFTPILIFALCHLALAQTQKSICEKISIKAPHIVRHGESFTVFAYYEKETQPSISQFNWIIIEKLKTSDNITKINNRGIVELKAPNYENGGIITILVETPDKNCEKIAMAEVVVEPAGDNFPLPLAEYEEINWLEERQQLESVISYANSYSKPEKSKLKLLIQFDFDKKKPKAKVKNHLLKIFNYLSGRGIQKNQIKFFISESNETKIRFSLLFEDSDLDLCDNCLIIKGEYLEKINSLFQSKATTIKRKK